MKKISILSFILILVMILSGCAFPGGDTETMLTPPSLGIGRDALTKAMKEIIGEEYELVYPQDGAYRTGVIPVDLNVDGENEAVCFYRLASGKNLGFLVMQAQADGSWSMIAKGSSTAASVGRVEFGDLNGDGMAEMIVGWHYLSEAEGSYEVFSLGGWKALRHQTGIYSKLILTQDSPSKLIVLSRNSATKAVTASLIGATGNEIGVINTVAMNDRTTEFLSILSAKTSNGLPAVYVDERLESGQAVTEVLVVNRQGELTNELLNQLNTETLRYTPIVCMDNNADGIPEIPQEEALPSYRRNGVEENLYLINWCTFDGAKLKSTHYSYVDTTEKFIVKFASDWKGKITVERQEKANRAFDFKTIDGEQLFTLRIYALSEYAEDQSDPDWQKLYEDSDHVYSVRINGGNSKGLDYNDIYNAFSVI